MKLTPTQREKVIRFIDRISSAIGNRLEERVNSINEFVARWEARSKTKNWPWPGASSLHVPMVAIVKDAIDSRILNALQGQDRDINVRPVRDIEIGVPDPRNPSRSMTWRDIAELLEQYMLFEISENGEIPFRDYMERLVDEVTLTGTGFSKIEWETIRERSVPGSGRAGEYTLFDNARFSVRPLESILFPPNYDSLERIPYFGERYFLRPAEMIARCGEGDDDWNVQEVRRFLREHPPSSSSGSPSIRLDGTPEDEWYAGEVELCESWIRIDLDGFEYRLVVDHPWRYPEYIFRVIPWPYAHGRLPYPEPARYIRRRGRLLGMGIAERSADLDEGISTSVNQIIDNATISNTKLWSVNENVRGARNLRDIYPGKIIFRGDDPNDIVPLDMGSVHPDLFEGYNILRDLFERVTKVSDYNLGRESSALGKQATATSTLALLQESGQYFDTITRQIRQHINQGLFFWLSMIIQFKPRRRIAEVVGTEYAEILVRALDLSFSDLRKRIAVSVSFSNTAATRELARQEEMAKWQILESYYQGLVQLAMTRLQAPQLAPLIDQIASDADRRIRALLEAFGEQYNTSSLPNWEDFVAVVQQQGGMEMQQEGMPPEEVALRQQELEQKAAIEQAKLQSQHALRQQEIEQRGQLESSRLAAEQQSKEQEQQVKAAIEAAKIEAMKRQGGSNEGNA